MILPAVYQLTMHHFQILAPIGQGSFSVVYRARRKLDNKVYAIKQMKMAHLTNQQKCNCLNEILYLANITHPNVIKYKQAFYEQEHLNLVTEYAQNGSLLQYMIKRRRQRQPFAQDELGKLALEMVSGLHVLHRTNIIHRDIKAANYFLMADGQVKLGDMNVSAISKNGLAVTKIGTPYYTSPEIWQELPYSFASDIWSYGCLLYQMVTFQRPFIGLDIAELKQNILTARYASLPETCPQPLREIIEGCLKKQPKERYSAASLVSNAYLKQKFKAFNLASMKKGEMDDKQYTMNCMRILREIKNQDTFEKGKLNLPKSKYLSNKKIPPLQRNQSAKGITKRSCSKKITPRLMQIYTVYNQKPPFLNKANIPHETRPVIIR